MLRVSCCGVGGKCADRVGHARGEFRLPVRVAGRPAFDLRCRLGAARAGPIHALGWRADRNRQGVSLRLARLQPPDPRLPLRDDQLVRAFDDPLIARRQHQSGLGHVLQWLFDPYREMPARDPSHVHRRMPPAGHPHDGLRVPDEHVLGGHATERLRIAELVKTPVRQADSLRRRRLQQDGTRHALPGRPVQPAVAGLPEAADRPGHRGRGRRHLLRQLPRFSCTIGQCLSGNHALCAEARRTTSSSWPIFTAATSYSIAW